MDKELMEQFSREELVAMGEIEPETTDPGPETQESEKKPEAETEQQTPEQEQKPEAKEEEKKAEGAEAEPEPEEGKPVPYDRFAKVYGRAKQTEREREELKEKLDLFKRNPEEYYEKYPDEKPEDFKPEKPAKAETLPEKVRTFKEMLGAKVNDPQNPAFHGKSLSELLSEGPEGIAAAHDYYNEYVESIKGQVEEAKKKENERLEEMRREDNRFFDTRAQELFGKRGDELDAIQKGKVEKVVKDTLAWMKANKRLAYSLADAYKVMTYDEAIKNARDSGAKALVDKAKSGNVRNIGSGPSGEKSSDPYAAYLSMTEDDLGKKIGDMTDEQYEQFLKKATPAFRQKFPLLPYPD